MVCFSFSFIFLPLPNLCEQLTVWSVSSFPSTARRHLGGKQCLSCQPPEPAADHSACSRHMPASLLLPPGYWRHTESSAGQIHLKKKKRSAHLCSGIRSSSQMVRPEHQPRCVFGPQAQLQDGYCLLFTGWFFVRDEVILFCWELTTDQ